MAERVGVGETFGRWTVIRHAAPQDRGGRSRSCCVVRCVCGIEAVLFEDHLKSSKSTGCKDTLCRHRFPAVLGVKELVDDALAEFAATLHARLDAHIRGEDVDSDDLDGGARCV